MGFRPGCFDCDKTRFRLSFGHTFITPSFATAIERPTLTFGVAAGFPSPADDYLEGRIDLDEHEVEHPAATSVVRVAGDSMEGAGIAGVGSQE